MFTCILPVPKVELLQTIHTPVFPLKKSLYGQVAGGKGAQGGCDRIY